MVNGEFYPGGVASALELQGDKMTAIYLDRREPLAVALQPAAPSRETQTRRHAERVLRYIVNRTTGSPSRAIRSS